MLIKIELPETQSVIVRKDREVIADISKFPPNALAHIFAYGLQRVVNDSVGAAGKIDSKNEEGTPNYATREAWLNACAGLAQKTLDKLYSGNLRRERAIASVDPVEREMVRLVIADFRSAGIKKDAFKDDEAFNEAIQAQIDSDPDTYRDRAETIIESRKNAKNVKVDLSRFMK